MINAYGLVILITVIALCEFAKPIGKRLALVDRPDAIRKTHLRPTPLVGGLALLAALILATVHAWVTATTPEAEQLFLTLLIAATGFSALGLVDDRRSIEPTRRLLIAAGLFGLIMLLDPRMVVTELDFGAGLPPVPLGIAALPFTLLCTVGLLNAVNMADGKNGLVLGLSIYWIFSLRFFASQELVPYLELVVLALVVVFVYNRFGRLFLGDSGSYVIGAIAGLLVIYVYNNPRAPFPVTIVILWLLVPVLDCLRVMMQRIRRGRSPFAPDSSHLHHLLAQERAWRWGFVLYLCIACGPGVLAMLWPDGGLALIAIAIAAYLVVLRQVGAPSLLSPEIRPGSD